MPRHPAIRLFSVSKLMPVCSMSRNRNSAPAAFTSCGSAGTKNSRIIAPNTRSPARTRSFKVLVVMLVSCLEMRPRSLRSCLGDLRHGAERDRLALKPGSGQLVEHFEVRCFEVRLERHFVLVD